MLVCKINNCFIVYRTLIKCTLHHSVCVSVVCPVAVMELSAEVAALQIAVLNTREELKNSLKSKKSSGEQFKAPAGNGADQKEKQEDTS